MTLHFWLGHSRRFGWTAYVRVFDRSMRARR